MSYKCKVLAGDLIEERDRLLKENEILRKALEGLLRLTSTIEVLGEWEVLEINTTLRKTTRAKVDEALNNAREALKETS